MKAMVILVLLLGLVLSSLPGHAAEEANSLPNVLLITIDTLRADHLSCYGYHRKTSPNIDKLASEGVRFENAYTAIPLTGPSHITMFTSRYPQEHGARTNGLAYDTSAKLLFLPQILRKFGYRSAGFISSWPLTSRLTRLNQFFDYYDEDLPRKYQMVNSMRFAEDVTPRALSWLKANHDHPFFLWVHYFDPHSPYHLREKFTQLPETGAPNQPGLKANSETRERVLKYDSEIGYADYYIGKLLDEIDKLGLRDSTAVFLLADHGESLGEHDYVGHGRHLYENIVRIPLIVRFPKVATVGKVVRKTVSTIDLSPTILNVALGKPVRDLKLPVELAGHSFAKSLDGGTIPGDRTIRYLSFGGKKGFFPRWLSFWWTDLDTRPIKVGSKTGSRKVIWSPRNDAIRVYNLAQDPFELAPFKPKKGSSQQKIETARLKHWYTATEGAAGENKMTEKDIEALKSLGYIQ